MSRLKGGSVWEATWRSRVRDVTLTCYREAWSSGSFTNQQKNKWLAAVLFAKKQSNICLQLGGSDCCAVVHVILQWGNVSLTCHVIPAQNTERLSALILLAHPTPAHTVLILNSVLQFPCSSAFFTWLALMNSIFLNWLSALFRGHYLERFHGRAVITHCLCGG